MLPIDPRVYFAGERTLLAWVRTGVAVIGLGFIVARFGLFLQLVHPAHPEPRVGFSAILGSVLVIFGGACTTLAAASFVSFLRALAPEEKPRSSFTALLALVIAFTVGAAGLLLGAFLIH